MFSLYIPSLIYYFKGWRVEVAFDIHTRTHTRIDRAQQERLVRMSLSASSSGYGSHSTCTAIVFPVKPSAAPIRPRCATPTISMSTRRVSRLMLFSTQSAGTADTDSQQASPLRSPPEIVGSSDGDDGVFMVKRAPASARKALEDARKLVRERRQKARDREAAATAPAAAAALPAGAGGVTEGSKSGIDGAAATKGDEATASPAVMQTSIALATHDGVVAAPEAAELV